MKGRRKRMRRFNKTVLEGSGKGRKEERWREGVKKEGNECGREGEIKESEKGKEDKVK